MERKAIVDRIIKILAFLKTSIELSSSINLTDDNIYSENFFRDFLNLLFGYQLQNINFSSPNAAAIDLGDTTKKLAIQVTATSALIKTKKTVKSFVGHKLHEQYDRLIILIITTKTKHNVKTVTKDSYNLDTEKDIWGINDLVSEINNLQLPHLKQVLDFLEKEIKFESNAASHAKEITTFLELMNALSDISHTAAGKGYIEQPDPEKKIYKRFADESAYLTKEFQDLYTEYGDVLKDVSELADIGPVRIRRLGAYLKQHSDNVLDACNGNAKVALDTLVNEYDSILSKNGAVYEKSAIRFFLVHQLIQCNVFPNKDIAS